MTKSPLSSMWFSSFLVKTGHLSSGILAFICAASVIALLCGFINFGNMQINEQDAKQIAALDLRRGKEPRAIRSAGLAAKQAAQDAAEQAAEQDTSADNTTGSGTGPSDEQGDNDSEITIDRVVAWLDTAAQEALIDPEQTGGTIVFEPSLDAWYKGYLCPLRIEGWGSYRDIARKLVAKNYGQCDGFSQWTASVPIFYQYGIAKGLLLTVLLIIIGLFSGYLAWRTRRVLKAYNWLYYSNILS